MKTDPIFISGVEYSTYPPPSALVKVMDRSFAKKFIEEGSMRFGHLETYRRWENEILGDRNDGIGMFHMNGNSYRCGSLNDVYAWCAAHTSISNERIKELALYGQYDCLVRINDTAMLINRIMTAISCSYGDFLLHCSNVSYNRGEEVYKQTLNSQKFHFNVFQKDKFFIEDKEYRLSITDYNINSIGSKYIDILVGNCSDIVVIEDLP